MGIGFHELSLLKFAKKEKDFKTLGIIGRQENYINSNSKIIQNNFKKLADEKYSDNLLNSIFELDKLCTFDISDKDNPTKVSNFNFQIDNCEKFDAFFDGGSLQHTYNIPIVMKNISNHVKVGGSIMHAVSSNNLCGFGFYQISPEFFIKYYSEKNGFKNTKIFVADYDNTNNWYQVNTKSSENIIINTSARLICLVKTEKYSEVNIEEIFQDIFFKDTNNRNDKVKKNLIKNKIFFNIYLKILIFIDIFSKKINLRRNKNLKLKRIMDLIS